MPVTEFATLKIKEPHSIQIEPLGQHFRTVAQSQAAWSGYPLTFYSDDNESSSIYLVSGWKDVDTHMKWIASGENQNFMAIFEPFLSVEGLAHIDIDFAHIPSDTQTLKCRKEIVASQGSELAEGIVAEGGRLWAGQGIDVENQKDCYYFEAYGDVLQETTNAQADKLKVMRRIHFN